MNWFALFFVFFFQSFSRGENADLCNLPPEVLQEIRNHQSFVDGIVKAVTQGDYRGRVYKDLQNFLDTFGSRFAGSNALTKAIKYLGQRMEYELNGIGTVKYDPVEIPIWKRDVEEGEVITSNGTRKLRILGLGYSPEGNVTAPLIVINDFKELENKSCEVKGNIVLVNGNLTNYKDTPQTRMEGPASAGKLGAVAVLVRSTTPFSSGSTNFGPDATPIPTAAVTMEDAKYLNRMYRENVNFQVKIMLAARKEGKGNSSNLIFDIPGSVEPKSYSVVSGHIDSWDVGQGALDDGRGALVALHSLLLLKHLKVPPPRRTFRAVLWTGEELGLIGAKTYVETHKEELRNWTAAYESNAGMFPLLGLSLAGGKNASCILKEVLSLFKSISATALHEVGSAGSDITVLKPLGVPLIEPYMVAPEGDSKRTSNSTVMDKHLAISTATTYILANLSVPFRDPATW